MFLDPTRRFATRPRDTGMKRDVASTRVGSGSAQSGAVRVRRPAWTARPRLGVPRFHGGAPGSCWLLTLAISQVLACSGEQPVRGAHAPAAEKEASGLTFGQIQSPVLVGDQVVVVSNLGLHLAETPESGTVALPAPVAWWPAGSDAGAPVVLDGAVARYVVVPITTPDGRCEVRAFEVSGAARWSRSVTGASCRGIAVTGQTLAVAAAGGVGGWLTTLSAETGEVTGVVVLPSAPTTAPTLVAGGAALAVGSGSQVAVARIGEGGVLATGISVLDAGPYELTSLFSIGAERMGATARPLSVAPDDTAGTVVLRFRVAGDQVIILEPPLTTPGPITASPVAGGDCPGHLASGGAHWWCGNGVIASGGAHWLGAYDAATGAVLASLGASSGGATGLALGADGRVYSGGAHWLGGWRLLALDPAALGSGTSTLLAWRPELTPVAGASPLVLCDGRVIDLARTASGGVVLVTTDTGAPGLAPFAWARADGGPGNRRGLTGDRCLPAGVSKGNASVSCAGAPGSLHALSPMGAPRGFACGAYYGGRVFVFGGVDQETSVPFGSAIQTAEALDLTSGTWSPIASIPVPTAGAACAAIGHRIVVAGGWSGDWSTQVHVYDAQTDTWSAGPPLREARAWPGSAMYKGRLYLAGGVMGAFPGKKSYLASVEALDPVAGAWMPAGRLSSGRYGVGLAVQGGQLYALGGDSWVDGQSHVFATVERMDGNTWVFAGDLATPLSALRPLGRPDGLSVLHWNTLYDIGVPGWEMTDRFDLPVNAHSFQSAIVETPLGVVIAGSGAWGPNTTEVYLLCP